MALVQSYKKGNLSFTRGNFDDYAVLVRYPGMPKMPKDSWYFSKLRLYKYQLGTLVYDHFCTLYEKTTAKVDETVFDLIREFSKVYPEPEEAEVIFGILYMGMIAEENKAGAVLKKRIKRLGVHQVLVEGLQPGIAADFSRGKSAVDLTKECHSRGF